MGLALNEDKLADFRAALRCPKCRGVLLDERGSLRCADCFRRYPFVGTVPILINEDTSVFRIADFEQHRPTYGRPEPKWQRLLKQTLPSLGVNLRSRGNYQRLADLVSDRSPGNTLIVGGDTVGKGMEPLIAATGVHLLETDVTVGGRAALVCDAHDLPFADGSFDAVVAQAVLEHVANPDRCVQEIHRVLKEDGIVYAETPFMQQVHGGRYDFTRFTPLGHRRLFRHFTQIDAGSGAGPATVLAWSYLYFLRGFARTRHGAQAASVIARLTGFWLKYIDRAIVERDGAQDGSWGYFFLGRKSATMLSDREVIALYRGLT